MNLFFCGFRMKPQNQSASSLKGRVQVKHGVMASNGVVAVRTTLAYLFTGLAPLAPPQADSASCLASGKARNKEQSI
jgi:hypothetical protein